MDSPTKVMVGIILFILFLALSPVLFSQAGILNNTFLDSAPVWYLGFFLVGLLVFVVRMMVK